MLLSFRSQVTADKNTGEIGFFRNQEMNTTEIYPSTICPVLHLGTFKMVAVKQSSTKLLVTTRATP